MNAEHALAQLRHLYAQMLAGLVKNNETAAHGLLGPSIEAIERSHRAGQEQAAEIERLKAELAREKQAADVWRKRIEAAAEALADVMPGEVGRLDLIARIEVLKNQRDDAQGEVVRLTAIGQVAEDRAILNGLISDTERTTGNMEVDARSALSRLAAKAQGYEAFVEACRDALGPYRSAGTSDDVVLLHKDLEAARAFSVQFGDERDAAVADNAAHVLFIRTMRQRLLEADDLKAAVRVADRCGDHVDDSHPGADLLEQMQDQEATIKALADALEWARSFVIAGGDANRKESVDVALRLAGRYA
jgi:predicted  nucleic acid-binding Zn-ribbon protein